MTDRPPVDLPPETLQRYLSDLARIGQRYGIELRPDPETGVMRITPISTEMGGYRAARRDDGPPVLLPYQHDRAPNGPADVAGDDMHPSVREDRARRWQEDNAAALADEGWMIARLGGPFAAAFRGSPATADPDPDLDWTCPGKVESTN